MGLPAGKTIALSPLRRAMCDMLHFSRRVPLVAIERHMPLGEVVGVRQALVQRPSWFALFLKGYALVAIRREELRRSYLPLPWPRLHQHEGNVASLAVARRVGDEDAVLPLHIRCPERRPLAEIDAIIRGARTAPFEHIGSFRRAVRVGRLPQPLRRLAWRAGLDVAGRLRARYFGTFGVTGVAALGSASLNLLSPVTTTLTFGVFAADGSVPVRLFYDHRVLDGIQPAAALRELEEALRGPILEELRGASRRAA